MTILNKPWLILLTTSVVLLPAFSTTLFSIHPFDVKRLMQVLICAIALFAIATSHKRFLSSSQFTLLITALIPITLSTAWSAQPIMALLEATNILAVFLSCLLFSRIKNAPQTTLKLAAAAAAVYSLVALVHLGNSLLLGLSEDVVSRLPGFSNIRAFSHWQTWALPLIGALPFFHRHIPRVPRYWLWALAISWWFLFHIAAGRGTALSALVAVTIVAISYRRAALPWLKTIGIAAITGITLGYLWISLESLQVTSNLHADGGLLSGNTSDRLALWSETWDMFLANPWLGLGPMHYANATTSALGSPHNSILLMLAETGFVTTTAIVCLVAAGLLRVIKTSTAENIDFKIAIASACIAAAVHSLFSGIQLAPYSQLWLIIIVGTAIQLWQQDPSTTQANKVEKVLAVSVACILIGSVIYTVIDPALPDPWADIFGAHYPRFWSHGQF